MTTRHLRKSRRFAASVEHAYETVLRTPLPDIFNRRHLVIAPIAEVIGETGVWGSAVGQSRTIRLSDGATMLETLTSNDSPRSFQYSISDLTGPIKALVTGIDGTWAFAPDGDEVEVTWSWDVTPKGRGGAMAMPVFAWMWSGYANKAMEEIQLVLVT